MVGLQVGHGWAASGPLSGCKWAMGGQEVGHRWAESGPKLGSKWAMGGQQVGHGCESGKAPLL